VERRLAAQSLRVAAGWVLAGFLGLGILFGWSSSARADASSPSCRAPGAVSPPCGVIVFDGDSIAAGVGGSTGRKFDEQFMRELTLPARLYNVAVGGRPAFECLRLYAELVAPKYERPASFNLIVFHAGDNDVAQGKSADQTYQAFTDYVARAHAQGWKIIVSTEFQRIDFPPSRQAELTSYNKQLLANPAGADAVVDFNADPAFADLARRDDPALFTKDRIHPSDGGYAMLARMLAAGVQPLLSH
jgi:lysophospholipase L1-like esterase